MDRKYRNIFWHQGVKVFSDNLLNTKRGRVKIEHLENDVTKSFLNILEHCNRNVLKAFLQLISVKESPHGFGFEFQITDNQTYQQRRNRVFLVIKTESTSTISSPRYNKSISRPDGCIHSENTAILIEAKTQSPIVKEQNENHIKHFLNTATATPTITWELISEKFKLLEGGLSEPDKFLVAQFCEFLDLIGIAEFNGFSENDFNMLGSIGKLTTDDFIDFKRIFLKKIDKFMGQLKDNVQPIINTNKYESYTGKSSLNSPAAFSSFYFYDKDPKIHINKYPNLNFIYDESGILFTITGEVKSSFKRILKKITGHPVEFANASKKLKCFDFLLYYKLQFAPMDNFLWNLIPGFPKEMGTFNSDDVTSGISKFKGDWDNVKATIIYQMKTKVLKHYSGRYFEPKEINFAEIKNPRPNFAIRIGRRYEATQIEKMGKKIVPHFEKEILKLNGLIDLLRP